MSEPYYTDATVTVHHGDCLDVLASLPDASVDAVVTDPPYGLEFMGKEWDSFGGDRRGIVDPETWGGSGPYARARVRYGGTASLNKNAGAAMRGFQAWCELWATECLRVLKPGGHMLAFGGTRTSHRLACAIEDAGFEIRDSIAWLYGSGFPKSLDVSKAIDKAAGVEREVVGVSPHFSPGRNVDNFGVDGVSVLDGQRDRTITAPATPDAERWQGWGTALKPAFEPVVVARKPLIGTVAANVLGHGTGALNIDECRVASSEADKAKHRKASEAWVTHDTEKGGIRPDGSNAKNNAVYGTYGVAPSLPHGAGRWPANVVLDESQAEALDVMSGESVSKSGGVAGWQDEYVGGTYKPIERTGHDDTGGASRFFYTAKASSDERVRLPSPGGTSPNAANRRCATCKRSEITGSRCDCPTPEWERETPGHISHPTVKPLALMRWLVRLVTPPGGTCLEPFAGSGTTVEACILEGFRCIAIEREADYLPLIVQRINRRRDPVAAVKASGEDQGLFDLLGGDVA